MPDSRIPRRVVIEGVGTFKVGGEQERQPVWHDAPIEAEEGDFEAIRTVQLSDPQAGFTGSRRSKNVQPVIVGIADSEHADTSIPGQYGAGPAINEISLGELAGNVGSIGMDLVIGESSLSGGAIGQAELVWSAGQDEDVGVARYIYVAIGDHVYVLDPADDHRVLEDHQFPGVIDWDRAEWLGQTILVGRTPGGSLNVMAVEPRNGSAATQFTVGNFAANHVVAGPDAIYFHLFDATNKALVKKSTADTIALLLDEANLSPTTGETMGDPGVPITRMVVMGNRFATGKEDGFGEFDTDLTYRSYLPWMAQFRWELQCNGLLPLGQLGDVLVTYRRGLYHFPANRVVGLEAIDGNETDKRGRYTALGYSGRFIYAALLSPESPSGAPPAAAHLFKMQQRRTAGPGPYEHHHIDTIAGGLIKSVYIWPGAYVDGVALDPRIYYPTGQGTVRWYVAGETLPEAFDTDRVWHDGEWYIQWPRDDFGSPETPKIPYRMGGTYRNVEGTDGVRWQVRDGVAGGWVDFTSDGTPEGAAPVTDNGFARRFAPRDRSVRDRAHELRMVGRGGLSTARQYLEGLPTFSYIEQPASVVGIAASFELAPDDQYNPLSAQQQLRDLQAAVGRGPFTAWATYVEDDSERTERLQILIKKAERSAQRPSGDEDGMIYAAVAMTALQYEDVDR